jgi:hypothetical protein
MSSRTYEIAGVPCVVAAAPAVLDKVDCTYGAFRADLGGTGDAVLIEVADGEPLHDLFNKITNGVVERLARAGVYPIHAAALEHDGAALIISGRSHSGKTTLALGLLERGLRLLSDELALSGPQGREIMPYRRALHVRPGTPELIEPLAFLENAERRRLGGDIEWSLLPAELEEVFPGSLGSAAQLDHVVLLGARAGSGAQARLEEVPASAAAIDLVRSTPAADYDFAAALERMARLTDGARCARLHSGALAESVELVLAWLDE